MSSPSLRRSAQRQNNGTTSSPDPAHPDSVSGSVRTLSSVSKPVSTSKALLSTSPPKPPASTPMVLPSCAGMSEEDLLDEVRVGLQRRMRPRAEAAVREVYSRSSDLARSKFLRDDYVAQRQDALNASWDALNASPRALLDVHADLERGSRPPITGDHCWALHGHRVFVCLGTRFGPGVKHDIQRLEAAAAAGFGHSGGSSAMNNSISSQSHGHGGPGLGMPQGFGSGGAPRLQQVTKNVDPKWRPALERVNAAKPILTESDHIWVFDCHKNIWARYRVENPPPQRYCAASTKLGDRLYIHGGLASTSKKPQFLEDLWSLKLPSPEQSLLNDFVFRWEKIVPKGDGPGPRAAHVLASHNGRLYLFGGVPRSETDMPFALYECRNLPGHEVCASTSPSRPNPSAVGESQTTNSATNSATKKNSAPEGNQSPTWYSLAKRHRNLTRRKTGDILGYMIDRPTPRLFPGCCVANDRLFIHGGANTAGEDNVLDIMEVFDFITRSWHRIPVVGTPPSGVFYHTMVTYDESIAGAVEGKIMDYKDHKGLRKEKILVIGGANGICVPPTPGEMLTTVDRRLWAWSEMFQFDPETMVWVRLRTCGCGVDLDLCCNYWAGQIPDGRIVLGGGMQFSVSGDVFGDAPMRQTEFGFEPDLSISEEEGQRLLRNPPQQDKIPMSAVGYLRIPRIDIQLIANEVNGLVFEKTASEMGGIYALVNTPLLPPNVDDVLMMGIENASSLACATERRDGERIEAMLRVVMAFGPDDLRSAGYRGPFTSKMVDRIRSLFNYPMYLSEEGLELLPAVFFTNEAFWEIWSQRVTHAEDDHTVALIRPEAKELADSITEAIEAKRLKEGISSGGIPPVSFVRACQDLMDEGKKRVIVGQRLLESVCKHQLVDEILTIRVKLTYLRPTIWREVTVPANMKVSDFDRKVLNPAMGWLRDKFAYAYLPTSYPGWTKDGPYIGMAGQSSEDIAKYNDLICVPLFYGGALIDAETVTMGQLFHKGEVGETFEMVHDLANHWLVTGELCAIGGSAGERPFTDTCQLLDGWGCSPNENFNCLYDFISFLNANFRDDGIEFVRAQGVMRLDRGVNNYWFPGDHVRQHGTLYSRAYQDRDLAHFSLKGDFLLDPTECDLQMHRSDILCALEGHPPLQCVVCGAREELRSCPHCDSPDFYCSRLCQLTGWIRHRGVCPGAGNYIAP